VPDLWCVAWPPPVVALAGRIGQRGMMDSDRRDDPATLAGSAPYAGCRRSAAAAKEER